MHLSGMKDPREPGGCEMDKVEGEKASFGDQSQVSLAFA